MGSLETEALSLAYIACVSSKKSYQVTFFCNRFYSLYIHFRSKSGNINVFYRSAFSLFNFERGIINTFWSHVNQKSQDRNFLEVITIEKLTFLFARRIWVWLVDRFLVWASNSNRNALKIRYFKYLWKYYYEIFILTWKVPSWHDTLMLHSFMNHRYM